MIRSIEQPVFLLGHSYGAHAALVAAPKRRSACDARALRARVAAGVDSVELARLEQFAKAGNWDGFATTSFHEKLQVPLELLNELRPTKL